MKHEELWMDFSEALDQYLSAREAMKSVGEGWNKEQYRKEMQDAAWYMDTLVPRECK